MYEGLPESEARFGANLDRLVVEVLEHADRLGLLMD